MQFSMFCEEYDTPIDVLHFKSLCSMFGSKNLIQTL